MDIDEHKSEPHSYWSKQDSIEPWFAESWQDEGLHWHAYVELRDGTEMFTSRRADRLRRHPDAILHDPEDVADWIAGMVRAEARREAVRLLASGGGDGWIGDEAHIEHERQQNLETAWRGDSIYAGIRRKHDRLHLWVEALTTVECPLAHPVRGRE